jgi:hypothetical protein
MSAAPTSFAVEEAQSLPAASTSTSHAEPQEGNFDKKPADQPVRQNSPAEEAAAMDDSASRVASVQEGSDRMMDSGPETLDQSDEGVVPNEQGASAAAANRGAERVNSLSSDPSVRHCALARCCPVQLLPCFSLSLSRGLCVDHEGWTSVVRLFALPCGMRGCDSEKQKAGGSPAESSAIVRRWQFS